jgi:hypothetical protein
MKYEKSNKSIGIYTDHTIESNVCEIIREYFPDHIDLTIFADIPSVSTDTKYSCLPSFYMYFFQNTIVFLNKVMVPKFYSKLISTDIYTLEEGVCKKYEI